MGFKRTLADFLERKLDARIVKKGDLPLLFEEEHLSRFFKHFAVDCVFDVGANAGQYADKIRDRCGFAGSIISFEPIPTLAAELKKRASAHKQWFVEPTLLDRESGTVEFNITSGSQFSSINKPLPTEPELFGGQSDVSQTLKLNASTLKIEFQKYQRLLGFRRPFLKMDTQGSDLEVAAGAGECLQQFVGLQSELAFRPIYENAPSAYQALDFYRSKGFELSAFVPNNAGHFPVLLESDCILYRPEFG